MKFEGVFTALVTPLKASGSGIDRKLVEVLLQRQIDAGIHGVILAGSTGEGQTLSDPEWEELLDIGLGFKTKIQILGACGSSGTQQTALRFKRLAEKGVHGALVSTPPYNKAPQRGLHRHFEMIAETADLPIMVYNIPGRTAVNLQPSTLEQLWRKSNIVSVKESSGSIEQMQSILSSMPPTKSLLSGDDPLNLSVWAIGGRGTVSVLSNICPKAVVQLWNLWNAGKIQEAQKLHLSLKSMTEALFVESNPIPAKFCISQILKTELSPRLPLVPLEETHHSRLKKELDQLSREGWL